METWNTKTLVNKDHSFAISTGILTRRNEFEDIEKQGFLPNAPILRRSKTSVSDSASKHRDTLAHKRFSIWPVPLMQTRYARIVKSSKGVTAFQQQAWRSEVRALLPISKRVERQAECMKLSVLGAESALILEHSRCCLAYLYGSHNPGYPFVAPSVHHRLWPITKAATRICRGSHEKC